jgi:hypothetical protein
MWRRIELAIFLIVAVGIVLVAVSIAIQSLAHAGA